METAHPSEKGDKFDVSTLMEITLRDLVGERDCEDASASLPAAFLRIEKSCDAIPLVDAARVCFIKLAPRLAQANFATFAELLRKYDGAFRDETIKEIQESLTLSVEQNRREGRATSFHPLVWIPASVPLGVMTTPMDDVVDGRIYSLSVLMPLQEDPLFQHGLYEQMTCVLFSHAAASYTEKSTFQYGYLITNENTKLNLFLSVVR